MAHPASHAEGIRFGVVEKKIKKTPQELLMFKKNPGFTELRGSQNPKPGFAKLRGYATPKPGFAKTGVR